MPRADGLDGERSVPRLNGAEHFGEARHHTSFDVVHRRRVSEPLRERGDRLVRDAAGHDQVEIGQVGIDIEREAMTGDPARDADANRRELAVADPDARQLLDASRLDAEIAPTRMITSSRSWT